ncbi:hypothetical protein [Microbaculum marinisediminis]|uniref:Uncharacterized protein n=1 Tax=Microbaculum marinisediminis TaxID=2931392 RepID=A0AAW5QV35_9HYPH|nr:hypothetical protein [Microbaculum sp. A6E488]MCT8970870.1 hypothetical protein [Microbaculum sp. A6E488]
MTVKEDLGHPGANDMKFIDAALTIGIALTGMTDAEYRALIDELAMYRDDCDKAKNEAIRQRQGELEQQIQRANFIERGTEHLIVDLEAERCLASGRDALDGKIRKPIPHSHWEGAAAYIKKCIGESISYEFPPADFTGPVVEWFDPVANDSMAARGEVPSGLGACLRLPQSIDHTQPQQKWHDVRVFEWQAQAIADMIRERDAPAAVESSTPLECTDEALLAFLTREADGVKKEAELRESAAQHFGTGTSTTRWKKAWRELPEHKRRPRGFHDKKLEYDQRNKE